MLSSIHAFIYSCIHSRREGMIAYVLILGAILFAPEVSEIVKAGAVAAFFILASWPRR